MTELDVILVNLKTQQMALVAMVSFMAREFGFQVLAREFSTCYEFRAAGWFAFVAFWAEYHRRDRFEVVDVSETIGEISAGEN